MNKIIGRQKEQKILKELSESRKSEFLALYGRRRIGKTFLIREAFDNHFTFHYAGRGNSTRSSQLAFFCEALKEQGLEDCPRLSSWAEAFSSLKKLVSKSDDERKVIFLDEIAWMDNPRSDFLPAFEGFWNEWAAWRDDVFLIICASATSWILKKVFHSRCGLHNRITAKIKLEQFTLAECEEYCRYFNFGYSREQILQLYMVLGGVAYYWTRLVGGYEASQNIEYLFFSSSPALSDEFENCYTSLFRQPKNYLKIVEYLGKNGRGRTRIEIAEGCRIQNNGALGDMLEELEECGFLLSSHPMGKMKNDTYYRLMDSYTLFYFSFIKNNSYNGSWNAVEASPNYRTWCALSYERVIMMHIDAVKRTLGISGVATAVYCWVSDRKKLEEGQRGAEIDILIDRADRLINIVEVKWPKDGRIYSMTKEDEESLKNKKSVFLSQTKTRKAVTFVLATVSGMKRNQYSELIRTEITLDDLFV